jgi:DNA/RNA-binding domain of Phe-tRNA-synthetase-like protein
MIEVEIAGDITDLLAGLVSATGMAIGPSNSELRAACADVVERVLQQGPAGGDDRREAVRRMLRGRGFKPAGRNKPAQEYLLRTVTESRELPLILNAVDWLNAVSLQSGLPISLLSASRCRGRIHIRCGTEGERFVFNRTGQELDLTGLICIYSEGQDSVPLGTPIKDSMQGKIGVDDRDVLAVIYAPRSAVTSDELGGWCTQLAQGFQQFCGAESCEIFMR